MKALKTLLFATVCSLLIVGVTANVTAQEKKAEATQKKEGGEKKKRDTYPFNGKLKSIDKVGMTLTLEGKEKERVIHITSSTKFTKAGKPATMDDGAAGEPIGGLVKKTADGKEEAVSVRYGAAEGKGKAKGKADKSKEEKK